jgi:hypothetical protein
MPIKMLDENCKIMTKDMIVDGKTVTFMFCQTKQSGKPCPKDTKGKKPYDLSAACFTVMSESDFLNDIVMPMMFKDNKNKAEASEVSGDGSSN